MKASLGAKRICPKCASRFYDLGKNPAACPKCGTMHDLNAPVKTRRGKHKAAHDADDAGVKPPPTAAKPKPKKPIKAIEGIDLEEFEDIETMDSDEEIEEIEEMEDIDAIEGLEDIDEAGKAEPSDEAAIESDAVDDDAGLIDGVDELEEGDEEEEDAKPKKAEKAPKAKGKK